MRRTCVWYTQRRFSTGKAAAISSQPRHKRCAISWWITRDAIRGRRLGAADSLAKIVDFLRGAVERPGGPDWRAAARRAYDALWREENKLLPVTVTSAVELDEGLVEGLGKRIEEQTGKKVELTSKVDSDVLGGLVLQVGNMVLDASIRNRLEQLRKQVAKAA